MRPDTKNDDHANILIGDFLSGDASQWLDDIQWIDEYNLDTSAVDNSYPMHKNFETGQYHQTSFSQHIDSQMSYSTSLPTTLEPLREF